jgi:hypothetical protein
MDSSTHIDITFDFRSDTPGYPKKDPDVFSKSGTPAVSVDSDGPLKGSKPRLHTMQMRAQPQAAKCRRKLQKTWQQKSQHLDRTARKDFSQFWPQEYPSLTGETVS